MQLTDDPGTVFIDTQFMALSSPRGCPAELPWWLALFTLLRSTESLSDRRSAEAARGRIALRPQIFARQGVLLDRSILVESIRYALSCNLTCRRRAFNARLNFPRRGFARRRPGLVSPAAVRAAPVCRRYLSNGYRSGRWWCVGDVFNTEGGSLYIRLTGPSTGKGARGKWTNGATGEHGDLLDVIRMQCGDRWKDALEERRGRS